MVMMTLACKVRSSEYQIRGPGRTDGMKTKAGSLSWPRRGPSLDRATVRLETISSSDFGPKMGFASPTWEPTCPFPWPAFLGFYWANPLAPL